MLRDQASPRRVSGFVNKVGMALRAVPRFPPLTDDRPPGGLSRRLTPLSAALVVLLAGVVAGLAQAAGPATLRLSKKQDAFFIENDFVYRRLLQLARDGTYRQINRERTAAAEVDRGTWEQSADGTVLLHFSRGGLRFHALLSGPLSITLDDPQRFPALPAAATAIRRWLAQSSNVVFASESAYEIRVSPVELTVDPQAESFRRGELEALARQIDDFVRSEQTRTFRLTPIQAGGRCLLVQQDAVFQAADLPRVRDEYPTGRGQPPPFYFAQVDAGTFARAAGSWQELR